MDSGSISCKNCGKVLDAWTGNRAVAPKRAPCPHCGVEAGINIKLAFSETIARGASEVSAVARSALTGREVTALDSRRPAINAAFNAVQTLVASLRSISPSEKIKIPAELQGTAREIEREFVASISLGLKQEYVRARWLRSTSLKPQEFLRPPATHVRVGRYNANGDRVLYLSRNIPTARAEVAGAQYSPQEQCYAQSFSVDLPDSKVVLLSRQMEARFPALNRFLFMSETLPNEGNGASVYKPTHLLRDWAEAHDVGAIEFPSVRAGFPTDHEAVNLVVFGKTAEAVEAMMIGEPRLVT